MVDSSAVSRRSSGSMAITSLRRRSESRSCHKAPDLFGGADEIGIEPAAAAVARDAYGGVRPALYQEDFEGLREQHNEGEEGNFVAAQAVGITFPVPVLVQGCEFRRPSIPGSP